MVPWQPWNPGISWSRQNWRESATTESLSSCTANFTFINNYLTQPWPLLTQDYLDPSHHSPAHMQTWLSLSTMWPHPNPTLRQGSNMHRTYHLMCFIATRQSLLPYPIQRLHTDSSLASARASPGHSTLYNSMVVVVVVGRKGGREDKRDKSRQIRSFQPERHKIITLQHYKL